MKSPLPEKQPSTRFYQTLKKYTPARIGLGTRGHSIPTSEILEFRMSHALARDAVLAPWNVIDFEKRLQSQNESPLIISTQTDSREEYLRRPDLGKKLSSESILALERCSRESSSIDLCWIVSDGLSSTAVSHHFLPFWNYLRSSKISKSFRTAPLVLAPFSRVAIGDEIGFYLKAKMTIVLIGERPGLTSSDSLGVYITYEPRPGRKDSERNCISNIRPPDGLTYLEAKQKLEYLVTESFSLKLSGIGIKERMPSPNKIDQTDSSRIVYVD